MSIDEEGLTRAQFLQRTAAVGSLTLLPGFLAACGSDSGGGGTTAASTGTGTVRVLTWEGYADPKAFKPFTRTGVQLKPIPMNADDVDNISKSGQYDIGTGIDGLFPTFVEADIVQPLDLERLPNYKERIESDAMFSPETGTPPLTVIDGETYGVPVTWGTLGISYLKGAVNSVPSTIEDLLEPEYSGKLGLVDDPVNLIQAVARLLGLGGTDTLGNSPAPLFLSQADLDAVFEKLGEFKVQAKSIYPNYGSLVSAYARKEIVAAMPDWAPTAAAAADEGGFEVVTVFPPTSRTFVDCMFISSEVEATDELYAFLDQALSEETQYKIGKALSVAVINREAMSRLASEGPAWSVYENPDQVLRQAPSVEWPPARSDDYLTFTEILKQWQEFKAAA